jgi:hypothetical protein
LRERHEYRLTEIGKDLYGSLVAMMAWDRWLSHGKPPTQLTHGTCGRDFTARVICDRCRKPVTAFNMKYRLTYDPGLRSPRQPRQGCMGPHLIHARALRICHSSGDSEEPKSP